MPLLKVGNHNSIYYETKGQGPHLLMLRGLARSSAYWLGLDERLSCSFTVITIDYRGIGRSISNVGWQLKIADLAADCIAVLDHLQVTSLSIIGHSLGGMVAISMQTTLGKRVDNLMIVNSSASPAFYPRVNPLAIVKLMYAKFKGQAIQPVLFKLLSTKTECQDEVVDQWDSILFKEGLDMQIVIKQLLAAARFRIPQSVKKDDIKPLIVCGMQDNFVPPINSRKIFRHFKGARFLLLNGGHELFLDCESELTEIILKEYSSSP